MEAGGAGLAAAAVVVLAAAAAAVVGLAVVGLAAAECSEVRSRCSRCQEDIGRSSCCTRSLALRLHRCQNRMNCRGNKNSNSSSLYCIHSSNPSQEAGVAAAAGAAERAHDPRAAVGAICAECTAAFVSTAEVH